MVLRLLPYERFSPRLIRDDLALVLVEVEGIYMFLQFSHCAIRRCLLTALAWWLSSCLGGRASWPNPRGENNNALA